MNVSSHLKRLLTDYPVLVPQQEAILQAYERMRDCFRAGGKLLVGGNGGSACDAEHIAGELMKGFLLARPLPEAEREKFCAMGPAGVHLAERLQRALPVIVLSSLPGLSSAFLNDVDGTLTYAQVTYAYASAADVLLVISTSGNAENAYLACLAARARGAGTLLLTGKDGGRIAEIADVVIRVPEVETYRVQELHLPVYHALCAMLEEEFFGEAEGNGKNSGRV